MEGIGQIVGTITSAAGQCLSGSVVTADIGASTVSVNGFYLLSLPMGTYTVTASADGFGPISAVASVESSRSTALDFTLTPLTRPTATAFGVPEAGVAPLMVEFTAAAAEGSPPYTSSWDFGDGESINEQNPIHVYQSVGTFFALLTVTDDVGQQATDTIVINVTAPALTATAAASFTSGAAPLEVQFTGAAQGGAPPYTFIWDFGDRLGSGSQDPIHQYPSAGSFTVRLIVRDSAAQQNISTLEISVTAPPPMLSASASPSSGEAPLEVQLRAAAEDGAAPLTFTWDFGDGQSSAEQDPIHIYEAGGNFTAEVTVTDDRGVEATATVRISVTPSPEPQDEMTPALARLLPIADEQVSSFDPSTGALFIPAVEAPGPSGNVTVFEAELTLVPNSDPLTFDVAAAEPTDLPASPNDATFDLGTGILTIPAVEAPGTFNTISVFAVELEMVPSSTPPRFVLRDLTRLQE